MLAAARAEFGENGYDGATVRAIAGRAGVDPAMVNHWFGSKEQLFAKAVLDVPFDIAQVIDVITAEGPDNVGDRIVRTFLDRWDGVGGERFTALIRSITSHPEAMQVLKTVFVSQIFARLTSTIDTDRPELRATLCTTQLIGTGMARYVVQLEPIHSADIDTLAAAIGPTLQRYLTGNIDGE
ncbi:TetR family transcriptional regulator [Saccharomonospora sp. CUA-673]|uniref:TetR/AcrR family transcriptional regulator n=1 Tax=Saccharomonospora sp. CUA-673 TaxID=1904969 RepID=UPI000965CB1B|nr:TetR family transcriptional regulator [Saccharomonospora sp. CUA-673]OLT48533.1 TetR family transcriptional regulator [Saccharomonospora sp. CUA-673]